MGRISLLLSVFCFSVLLPFHLCQKIDNFHEALFQSFIKKYNRSYVPGTEEYLERFKIFKMSRTRQNRANIGPTMDETTIYGTNKFSDMTPEEFAISRLLQNYTPVKIQKPSVQSANYDVHAPNGQYFDWRRMNAMTPVKNQKNCGACWAFSLTETIESMNYIQNKELVELSTQQEKCDGGNIIDAVGWLKREKINITTERQYPLTDTSGPCDIRVEEGLHVNWEKTGSFYGKEEEMVQYLLTQGPLTVAVDATLWQDYMGGIIRWRCYPNVNHAVQIVGFNTTGHIPYFIARNSWGKDWGIDGYVHIEMYKNMCGIATEVVMLKVNDR